MKGKRAGKLQAQYQAEKLAAFIDRGGSENDWWRSKDFSQRERAAIKAALPRAREAIRPLRTGDVGNRYNVDFGCPEGTLLEDYLRREGVGSLAAVLARRRERKTTNP